MKVDELRLDSNTLGNKKAFEGSSESDGIKTSDSMHEQTGLERQRTANSGKK